MIGETQAQTDKMMLYSEGFLNYLKKVFLVAPLFNQSYLKSKPQ